jgi:hypothetical protein
VFFMLPATATQQQPTSMTQTQPQQLDPYDFVSWLCDRETAIVGYTGSRFASPLVEWLCTLVNYQCTVEGTSYTWIPLGGPCCWQALPDWGLRFQRRMDEYAIRPLTGGESLDILASIELPAGPLEAVA